MTERQLQLHQTWRLGHRIGDGGFGAVFSAVADDGTPVAVKLVPKAPGAARELLFQSLTDVRNIVPVIDSGETDTHYALVMPRADGSLAEHLQNRSGMLEPAEALAVLTDVATALTDLDTDGVVHRDLKPANILRLNNVWCLSDFGISRYAEATTAPDTRKYALSMPYAAPERWRAERATASTDVYSFGVIAYELLEGARPFRGPTETDFREQHLHEEPPQMTIAGAALASLVGECLYKAPQTRPRAANLVARLAKAATTPPSDALARLQEANRAEVQRIAADARAQSEAQSSRERRDEIERIAVNALDGIRATLRQTILDHAPAVKEGHADHGGWVLRLGDAVMAFTGPTEARENALSSYGEAPLFDVISYATVTVQMGNARVAHYAGRSHSLWFCDAQHEGAFQWFETAFMETGFGGGGRLLSIHPFAMPPAREAAEALSSVMTVRQAAWPFTPLTIGELDEFVARWVEWFAMAATGQLSYPSQLPERTPQGSWRR